MLNESNQSSILGDILQHYGCPLVIIFLTRLIWIEFWEFSWRMDKHRITMATLFVVFAFLEWVRPFLPLPKFRSRSIHVTTQHNGSLWLTGSFKIQKVWKMSESIRICLALLSIEWNSTRLGGLAHGIVTKTVHKTLPQSAFFPRLKLEPCDSHFQSNLLLIYRSSLLPPLHIFTWIVLVSMLSIIWDFISEWKRWVIDRCFWLLNR